jgi:hypothetical protein
VTSFKGCGHFPHHEKPEELAQAVAAFLDAPFARPVRIRQQGERPLLDAGALPIAS